MTYLDILNEILAMTPEERNQQVNLYENYGMQGYEKMNKAVSELRKNWDGEIQAVAE